MRIKILSMILVSTIAVLQGCKKSNSPESDDATPTSQVIQSFNNDSVGGWLSECTKVSNLNHLSLPATQGQSSRLSFQIENPGLGKFTIVSYPSKSDCTLNPGEGSSSYSKEFKIEVVAHNSKQKFVNVQLSPTDVCDKTQYLFQVRLDGNGGVLNASLLSAQLRTTSQSQLTVNDGVSLCVPAADNVLTIPKRSPLIGSQLSFRKTW